MLTFRKFFTLPLVRGVVSINFQSIFYFTFNLSAKLHMIRLHNEFIPIVYDYLETLSYGKLVSSRALTLKKLIFGFIFGKSG